MCIAIEKMIFFNFYPSARGAYMLRKFVYVGFHPSQGDGANRHDRLLFSSSPGEALHHDLTVMEFEKNYEFFGEG
jgi:hypothetical protein